LGNPVISSINDLHAAVHIRRHALDQRHLLKDGLGVTVHKGSCAASSCSHAIPGAATRFDPDKVVTEALQLVFDLAAAGITDGDDTNKCSNPYRDAENGKDTAEPVPGEGSECVAN
jgi:hypothetical protein